MLVKNLDRLLGLLIGAGVALAFVSGAAFMHDMTRPVGAAATAVIYTP
jgi:hypothetical protein